MKILLLLMSSVLFLACDYSTYVEIINKTEEEIKIHYYTMNENDNLSENIIELPNISGNQKYNINNGMNRFWTDEEIRTFIKNVHEVKIVTVHKTTIYNQEQLYEYFKKNREGRLLQKIKVVVYDN